MSVSGKQWSEDENERARNRTERVTEIESMGKNESRTERESERRGGKGEREREREREGERGRERGINRWTARLSEGDVISFQSLCFLCERGISQLERERGRDGGTEGAMHELEGKRHTSHALRVLEYVCACVRECVCVCVCVRERDRERS